MIFLLCWNQPDFLLVPYQKRKSSVQSYSFQFDKKQKSIFLRKLLVIFRENFFSSIDLSQALSSGVTNRCILPRRYYILLLQGMKAFFYHYIEHSHRHSRIGVQDVKALLQGCITWRYYLERQLPWVSKTVASMIFNWYGYEIQHMHKCEGIFLYFSVPKFTDTFESVTNRSPGCQGVITWSVNSFPVIARMGYGQ